MPPGRNEKNPMAWLASLDRRERVPELMDEPDIDPSAHRLALSALARINALSFSADILWPPLAALARAAGRPVRVLDVATGAGDVPVRLWKRAKAAGLPLAFEACDVSPTALAHAREAAEKAGAAVRFFAQDVLRDALPGGYDAVICSLFLHHLAEDDAVAVLRRMRAAATRRVLVNDLARSKAGYALARAVTRVLTRSPVVRFDGPVSVRSAFTPIEAKRLAEAAGLAGVRVGRRWPFRFLLSGRPG